MNIEPILNNLPVDEASANAIPYPALLLSVVYRNAGLPPADALRAAMADYEHGFSSWDLKMI